MVRNVLLPELARVPGAGHIEALAIPAEAVVLGRGGASVFVVDEERGWRGRSRARRVPVVTGGRGGGRVEIVRGVTPGERVIVSGVAFLDDGVPVTEAETETEGK